MIGPLSEDRLSAALDRPFGGSAGPDQRQVRHVNVDALDLPTRVVDALRRLKVKTVEQLVAARRADLLAQPRMGEVSLKRIQEELWELLFPPYVGDGDLGRLATFAEMVAEFVHRAIPEKRKAAIVLGRLQPSAERPSSLNDLGVRHSLSRERVRQITDDALARLAKPAKLRLLRPFWKELWAILESWQRPIALERLSEGLRRRLHWQVAPGRAALRRFLQLHSGLSVTECTVGLRRLGQVSPGGESAS